ncbi:MAG: phosphatase PAP2 family protein [Planctomycetota bacterium]
MKTAATHVLSFAIRSCRGFCRVWNEAVRMEVAGSGGSMLPTRRQLQWLLATPAAAMLAFFLVFRLTDLDLLISGLFYDARTGEWPSGDARLWSWLYEYGCVPATVVGVGGAFVGLACLMCRALRGHAGCGLFLTAVLAVGPGLLVNLTLKPYVGRPRPREVTQFGGERAFVPVGQAAVGSGRSDSLSNSSFPSGHASMGFYLMAPAALLYRKRRRAALAFLAAGAAFGGLIGVARVIQGAHFASDVIGSLLFVYLSIVVTRLAFDLIGEAWHLALLRREERTPGPEAAVLPFPAAEPLETEARLAA